jgi:hypothetical protein
VKIWASQPSDRKWTIEIRSGCAGPDARADRRVPRVSSPGILYAGSECGSAIAGGAHGSVARTMGGSDGDARARAPDGRGHGMVGPTNQRPRACAGTDTRTHTDEWGLPVSGIEG